MDRYRPNRLGSFRSTLLMGASLSALSLAVLPTAPARAGMASQAFFAQVTARLGSSSASAASSGGGTATSLAIPQVAQAIAARTQADLQKAIAAVTQAAQAQATALSSAAQQSASVPDGTASGGLVADTSSAANWQNAVTPVSAANSDGTTTVTVTQTAAKAIATWSSFNIGKNTTLDFDQTSGTDQSGNNAWVILNRVDASASPSQIYGQIQAKGTVYIINPNGVVFDGTSEVDVHALIASTLDIGAVGETTTQRDAQFLQEGLNITSGVINNITRPLNVSFSQTGIDASNLVTYTPSTAQPDPEVAVMSGARITTSVFPSDNPGSVMLLAPIVSNAGQIVSPAGQVILGAGRAFGFVENTTTSSGPGYLGLVPYSQPDFLVSSQNLNGLPGYEWGGPISATNTGLIETTRGNITLQGTTVENDGVLAATTSITRNGSIVLQGAQSVTLGPKSTDIILPDENGETIPSGQVSATTVPLPIVEVDAGVTDPVSLTNINTAGGALVLDPGADVVAPGADITLFGASSVLVGANATVDAAGLTTGAPVDAGLDETASVTPDEATVAALPMSDNFITFTPLGPEFANSPLQRDGVLRGQAITIDVRLTGTSADGIAWVGTPLANASGYVAADVKDSIDQVLTAGGNVTVSTGGATAIPLAGGAQPLDSIVLDPGSVIDASGGYVSYSGGYVSTTNLIGADGKVYSIGDADPNVTYAGIAGSFTVEHPHWGLSETYSGPQSEQASASFEPGYINGAAAGTITLSADAIEADGQLYGQASAGPLQRVNGTIPASGTLNINQTSGTDPQWVLLQSGEAVTEDPSTLFSQTTEAEVTAGYSLADLNPSDRADTVVLSTTMLDAGDFGKIAISGSTLVAAGASLTVANGGAPDNGASGTVFLGGGGTISIAGPAIDVEGSLSAASGAVSLTANGLGDPNAPADSAAITIGPDALIDVRGRWINDSGLVEGDSLGANYLNGGSISLRTDARATTGTSGLVDTTGGILVQEPAAGHGPQLLASSGGYVATTGKIETVSGDTGVPMGTGGSISLVTYAGGFTPGSNPSPPGPLTAGVTLDPASSISATGFTGGGTLKISVGPSILIVDSADLSGSDTISTQNGVTIIGSDLLDTAGSGYQNPFGTLDLESDYGAVVVANHIDASSGQVAPWTLQLSQSTFQTNPSLVSLPSYSTLGALATAPLPAYQATPVNLVLGLAGADIQYYPNAAAVSGTLSLASGQTLAYGVNPGETILQPQVTLESDPNRSGGASIRLNSTYTTEVDGTIDAHAGQVILDSSGLTGSTGTSEVDGQAVADGAVILAPGSVIDVSGAVVANSAYAVVLGDGETYTPTAVLPGGSVTLTATAYNAAAAQTDFGYVAQAAGSLIDLDGAAGTVQTLDPSSQDQSATSQIVYSDAGSVTVDATAAALDGTFEASGGAGDANSTAANGIFSLSLDAEAADVLISAAGRLASGAAAATAQTADFVDSGTGGDGHYEIALSSDLLDQGDFDDIDIGQTSESGGQGDFAALIFSGRVTLTSRRSMLLAGPAISNQPGDNTTIDTGYLTLTASLSGVSELTATGGRFDANARDIVLERGMIAARNVSLTAANDIAVASVPDILTSSGAATGEGTFESGGLITTGKLTIDAQRVYTMGGAEGVIQSLGASGGGGEIDFTQPGSTADTTTPLTAGGTLYVLGSVIEQGGVIDVPGGNIIFGDAGAQVFTFGVGASATPTIDSAQQVTLEPGSVTSVSLDGLSLPYGGTVDQVSWYYGDPTRSGTALSAPPAKSILINARQISLDGASATEAASILNLSGGGDLYASEFVAGTGGSANVLSPDSTYTSSSFNPAILGNVAAYNAVSSAGTATRTYDANTNSTSQVYAIVPTSENPSIAPSDLDFTSDTSPSTNPGTGFGNPAPPAGIGITLTGVTGIANGTYTLLPAAYATLPGAYRVVVVPGSQGFKASQNTTLADGTMVVSATVATALSPTASATESASLPIAVELQSRSVWGQYSDITTTSANSFFPSITAASATVPRLPEDAGALTLEARTSLNLAGTLEGSAADGLGSIVAIATQNLQVLAADRVADAVSGYVTVDATQLTDLDAGSLLLGGTESITSTGDVISASSYSVEVTSDAANPLSAPEILIVTRGDPNGVDALSANGLTVSPGAVIESSGMATIETGTRTITIGSVTGKIVGDGAFLAVSNGVPITLDRVNLPTPASSNSPLGTVTIGADAVIRGGNDLVIDASDGSSTSTIDPTAQLSGKNVTLSAAEISLGDDGQDGLVVPTAVVGDLAANATTLTLHAVGGGNGANAGNGIGDIEFSGVTSLALTAANSVLTLDATALSAYDGESVAISADTVNIADSSGDGVYVPTSLPDTALTISAQKIDFGTGVDGVAFNQVDQVDLTASSLVDLTGALSVSASDATVTITTPSILADSGSTFSLTTTGQVTLDTTGGAVASSGSALGGSVAFSGAAITVDTTILAPSGNISLEATNGDLSVGSDALLSAQGYSQAFFGSIQYAAGGTIKLTADAGNVTLADHSSIDVDAAPAGGAAGSLDLIAPAGAVTLGGTISGQPSASGSGGSFSLSEGGATGVDLTALAAQLSSAGFDGSISVSTASGNLDLTSGAITAASVSLTAQGGSILVAAGSTIDASGAAGGAITLFGRDGVDLEGSLLAEGSSAAQAGGTVEIGTSGVRDPTNGLDATYGYESIQSAGSGAVTLGPQALIDVAGGTVAGETGGTVEIRVPLLEAASLAQATVPLSVASGATIIGSYRTTLEGYAVWSTSDDAAQTNPALMFDGIVDPGGTASGAGDHTGFYGATLINFVENFPNAPALPASLGAVQFQPGIDLVNDDPSVNSGDITVASAWNLGAGGYDSNGVVNLFYRTAAGEPGTLTLRAVGNVDINADLTDGFFQSTNTLDGNYQTALGSYYLKLAPAGTSTGGDYLTPLTAPTAPYDTSDATYYTTEYEAYLQLYEGAAGTSFRNHGTEKGYTSLWTSYLDLERNVIYPNPNSATQTALPGSGLSLAAPNLSASYSTYTAQYTAALASFATSVEGSAGSAFQAPSPPVAPVAPSPTASNASSAYTTYLNEYYQDYAPAYLNYLNTVQTLSEGHQRTALNADGNDQLYEGPNAPTAPVAYGNEIATSTASFIAANPAALYGANGISPNATTNDPNPVMSADLVPTDAVTAAAGHTVSQGSWSLQIVGGADTGNVDPLALQSLANFQVDTGTNTYTTGTVTLDGHTTYQLASSIRADLAIPLNLPQADATALVPVLVRTGTGSIDVDAATNIVLADTLAPGTIYTAGVQTSLPSAGYQPSDGGTALNGPDSFGYGRPIAGGNSPSGDGGGTTTASDPAGFTPVDFGGSFVLTAPTLFAATTPAYPDEGGSITLVAQNDIIGVQSTLAKTTGQTVTYDSDSANDYLTQFWSSWLLTSSSPIVGTSADSFDADQGIYSPNVSRPAPQFTYTDLTAGQTTWWINFGSFDQGVAALGGGNVTVTAGHNIQEFSASTASTGRVSGGLDAADIPKLNVAGGGNLTVTAGNDILSGSYYVALGTGTITAGGSIIPDSANWSYQYTDSAAATTTKVTVAPAIILAVGDAQLSVSATGSVNIGDVVNPTEIESGVSLIVGDDNSSITSGGSDLSFANHQYFVLQSASFNTQTPDSAISVASIGGDVSFLTLPSGTDNHLYQTNYRVLPASVDVTAFRGDVDLDSSFDMTNSSTGSLTVDAYSNLRLVGPDNQFGTDTGTTIANATGEAGIATYQTQYTQTISTKDPLPGLIDTQFDPFNPAADYGPDGSTIFTQTASAQSLLLHATGSDSAQLNALTGDVTNGIVVGDASAVPVTALPMPLLTDLPVTVEAGEDVLNLQLYAQNTQATDVTSVIAGRDITYDLPATNLNVTSSDSNGDNLIELAGPGDLVLQAGRNLGPFPNNFNTGPSGVETTGAYDWTSSSINPALSSVGASVYAYAGVSPGIDASAETSAYIDPATATTDSFINVSYAVEYEPELLVYLRQLGPQYSNLSEAQAFADFSSLSSQQRQVFLDQVFFNQLQTTQSAPDILPELLGFEAANNLIGYSLNQIYGLFQNGTTTTGQQLLTQAYTVFAALSPATQAQFVTEIATDTSTEAPNIWHAYALFEGLTAAQREAYVADTSPSADLSYIENETPAQRQNLVHTIGTEALTETPSLWNAPGYARGYQIIDTLFSGSAGYTQNQLTGGLGANGNLVTTGKIDLRSATIQTQHGGSIQVFAPGGGILLGSSAARTIYSQPGSTGLLTFQGGAIDVFADQSLTVNQSRILTEEGGDVLAWSSNEDILAGSGAKTSADFPPYTVLYDADALESLNPAGLVTGAGIGALVTVNNQDPSQSNDFFLTPVGTVDAGDAGLRAAGNITVAAAHVANAGNITVGGKSTGVPTAPTVNVGALASANSAAASASHAADSNSYNRNANATSAPSVISIDILGFGDGSDQDQQQDDQDKKKRKLAGT